MSEEIIFPEVALYSNFIEHVQRGMRQKMGTVESGTGHFKAKISKLYAEMHTKPRQEILSSFIEQVQREMLEAVEAGVEGVYYHKDDIKCDPDDFVKWLRREGFIYKWDMGGLFRKPVLYIQFEG